MMSCDYVLNGFSGFYMVFQISKFSQTLVSLFEVVQLYIMQPTLFTFIVPKRLARTFS